MVSDYRYTPGRNTLDRDEVYQHGRDPRQWYGRPSSPEFGYADDSYGVGSDQNVGQNTMYYDPSSPFFGMDPQLAGFVQKHHVEMGDGAVVNVKALREHEEMAKRQKVNFHLPCGLSKLQCVLIILLIAVVIAVIVGLVVGLMIGLRIIRPSYPRAQPWWRRSQIYEIKVATWANDVGGPTGRLEDVILRMPYLYKEIGANSIILTDIIASDADGVIEWQQVDSRIAPGDEAFPSLLPRLVQQAKNPGGIGITADPIRIILGLPIYATSHRHVWFQTSITEPTSPYGNYYHWTTEPPKTSQEQRFYSFDPIRMAYYRHVHGNPQSPLLNLSDSQVQTAMKQIIQFWLEKLAIQGLVITNSTNVLPEMVAGARLILNSVTDENFVWFMDDPKVDQMVNPGNKVCFFSISINQRVPTRTDDLIAQLMQDMNDTRLVTCSPIWRVIQSSEDEKDFLTVQQMTYFLPGSFLMRAGQEVDLTTGLTELMSWSIQQVRNEIIYLPLNINLPQNGELRLAQWRIYWTAATRTSLLATPFTSNQLRVVRTRANENVLSIYREHRDSSNRVYFLVSFQTLNVMINIPSLLFDLTTPMLEVEYDTENMYNGRRTFGETLMVNNQVLLLYYY